MMLFTTVLCLFIASAACTSPHPDPPIVGDGPPYDVPPFPSETTCYLFIPCFTFPTKPVCGLPKTLCGGAYTFPNSCYLGHYNCEHESNQYYQYREGECYPQYIVDPPPPIAV